MKSIDLSTVQQKFLTTAQHYLVYARTPLEAVALEDMVLKGVLEPSLNRINRPALKTKKAYQITRHGRVVVGRLATKETEGE